MGREIKRLKKRKEVAAKMEELFDNAKTSLVIHYSCESFYPDEDAKGAAVLNAVGEAEVIAAKNKRVAGKTDGTSARVTSIAIRNLESGQTNSFSVHQVAEKKQIPFPQISGHYDELERGMLDEYFEFIRVRPHCNFIHWNMRDVAYGFAAIEHRYSVLGGNPVVLPESGLFDFSRALITLYGINYVGHPRLEKIIELNKVSALDFLSGKAEAKAWDDKEFVKLHRSTLRKVDVLANLFQRAVEKTLKVRTSWFEQNGFNKAAVGEYAKEHWVVPVGAALVVVAGLITKGPDAVKSVLSWF